MLRVEELRKTFISAAGEGARNGEAAVPIVDVKLFELGAGEQVALVGTSGSGKTTFLHLLAGILRADEGADGRVAGRIVYRVSDEGGGKFVDIGPLPEAQRDRFRGMHLGYIFQTHHLLPGLTALENVLMGMSFTRRTVDRAWARELLSRVGLADRLAYRPGKLSVGQQQRVAVARALANRPRVVLADEPTGALDAARAQGVLELIRALCTEVKAGLVLVTHDERIARQLSRRVELSQINRAAGAMPAESAR